ncbi:hypothetical protein DL96DRAFT_1249685 [Flagelloscypha sp. PMI_526]|nr:hypothetical protein DL96DRAFT_1249685 [Flagelloscypha sp. PMI_526]
METRSRRKAREVIARANLAIQNNRTQNKSTLVARLPNDILRTIFLLHKNAIIDAYQRGENCWSDPYRAIPWITPSHVCTLWRSVALELAGFWNTLLLGNPRATRELLLRSKKSPLTIVACRNTNPSMASLVECLSLLQKESQRIESWDLSSVTRPLRAPALFTDSSPMFALFEGVDFPILRNITIHDEDWMHRRGAGGRRWLQNFLKQPLKLTHIRMMTCSTVFWNALPLATMNGITSLVLAINIQIPFVDRLLSFLTCLPSLQRLEIEQVRTRDDQYPVEVQSINLPSPVLSSLYSLTLVVRPQVLELLLGSIRLSNQLSHCKVIPKPRSAWIDVDETLGHIRSFQPAAKSASIELNGEFSAVDVRIATYRELTAIESQTFGQPAGAWAPQPSSIYRSLFLPQIDIAWLCFQEPTESLYKSSEEDILAPVESLLQDVEVLALRLRCREKNVSSLLHSWISMLGRLPRLRRLDFWWPEVGGQRAFLSCLSKPPSLPHCKTTTRLLHFKALEEVHFDRAAFFHGSPVSDTADVPPTSPSTVMERRISLDDPQSIEDLFDVLEKRRTAGNNILKTMSFKKSSGVDSEVVERLRRVVVEVVWDGVMVWPYHTRV